MFAARQAVNWLRLGRRVFAQNIIDALSLKPERVIFVGDRIRIVAAGAGAAQRSR